MIYYVTTILLIIALYFILKTIKFYNLQEPIIELIVKAEDIYKQGQNAEKFDYVFNSIYSFLPTPFRILISQNDLKKLIQDVFDLVKCALDYKENGG